MARWWKGMEGMEGREGMDWGGVRNGELWGNMEEVRRQAGKARLGGGMMRWGVDPVEYTGRGERGEGRWEWECRLLYRGEKRLGNDREGIFYKTSTPPPQPAPLPTSISP